MFEFRSVELMNWDFWPHFELPIDERVIMLSGPNGSGKTTFLDSLRLLLGARTLSTGRLLGKYLRSNDRVAMVKAVVSNTLHNNKRPFRRLGINTDEATLACVVENKGGSWEKRFAILPGRATGEQIRANTQWFAPEEYGRELTEAGVSRSLLKILALEQGQTHQLCRKGPRELLLYLLEIQGDKTTLDRYDEARKNYAESLREIEQQEKKQLAMEQALAVFERRANEYRWFRDRNETLGRLGERDIPRARLRDLREERADANKAVRDAEATLGNAATEVVALEQTRADADKRLEELRGKGDEVRREQAALFQRKAEVDMARREIDKTMLQLDALKESVAGVKPEEIGSIEKAREERTRARVLADERARQAGERATALRMELAALETAKRVEFPRKTEELREVLKQHRIEHTMVAETIEVTDSKWQRAVESVLGGERFCVLVKPEDTLRARELARSVRYPHYVSEFESASNRKTEVPENSALSVTKFLRKDVPQWVRDQLARVTLVEDVAEGLMLGKDAISITADGYRQDRRGGIYVGVDRLYCGAAASVERVKEIQKRELPSALGEEEAARRDADRATRDEVGLSERVAAQARLMEWTKRESEAEDVRVRRATLRAQAESMTTEVVAFDARLKATSEAEREAYSTRARADQALQLLLRERGMVETGLPQLREALTKVTAQVESLEGELRTRALAWKVPAGAATAAVEGAAGGDAGSDGDAAAKAAARAYAQWLSDELLAGLPSVGVLRYEESKCREELGRFQGCREPEAEAVFDKARKEYLEFREFLDGRRRAHGDWTRELEHARKSYKRVVEQTVEFYRKNVQELGLKARIELDVAPMLMTDDDAAIDQAGLRVTAGFDGKKPVAIDHPDLSGGQSVLVSLVLLMAMAMSPNAHESEEQGFFILDEPFAHLSVERIDDVADFLKASKAQFILTTPTTHNANVFNTAGMTITLRKKRATDHAPAPTFIRRAHEPVPQPQPQPVAAAVVA